MRSRPCRWPEAGAVGSFSRWCRWERTRGARDRSDNKGRVGQDPFPSDAVGGEPGGGHLAGEPNVGRANFAPHVAPGWTGAARRGLARARSGRFSSPPRAGIAPARQAWTETVPAAGGGWPNQVHEGAGTGRRRGPAHRRGLLRRPSGHGRRWRSAGRGSPACSVHSGRRPNAAPGEAQPPGRVAAAESTTDRIGTG
jgi:hypothetical protein